MRTRDKKISFWVTKEERDFIYKVLSYQNGTKIDNLMSLIIQHHLRVGDKQ